VTGTVDVTSVFTGETSTRRMQQAFAFEAHAVAISNVALLANSQKRRAHAMLSHPFRGNSGLPAKAWSFTTFVIASVTAKLQLALHVSVLCSKKERSFIV
jgi:hypothetical protein